MVAARYPVRSTLRRLRGRRRLGGLSPKPGEPVDQEILRHVALRRKWALHRHQQLVSAFDRSASQDRIGTVLSIGCGAGMSELYLAAVHPEVRFTLTDFDPARLRVAEAYRRRWRLENVTTERLDLLESSEESTHTQV